ncbi:MAG: Na+/H+ antiporter NhaD type [Promethearchaeota archaeon CR_4]|nr:MAG: Na+/H+ antiporter NhaD type [Candidatus Lokiarchaeota archaeon CR_4]
MADIASQLVILITFVSLLLIVGSGKVDKTVVALAASVISYIVLVFYEHVQPYALVEDLFGTSPGYDNLHALILVFSMLAIVEIGKDGGVFQFLAFKLVQMTKGRPRLIMVVFSCITVFITAVLSDMLAIIILLPLTITVCRILGVDPRPYLVVQIVIVKVGAVMLLISSVSNIVISGFAGISFVEFFISIGTVALILLVVTIGVFLMFNRNRLSNPTRGMDILLEFNPWTFVPDRKLMLKSAGTIIGVIVGFAVIPTNVLSPDIIAFFGAVILFIIAKLNVQEIFKKIDFKLLCYLMGIFVITGAMERVGIIQFLANSIATLNLTEGFPTFVFLLWIAGYLSGPVDNIAIMRVLIPIANQLTTNFSMINKHLAFNGIIFGINLGDNLTPLGDSMLGIQIAEQNKFPISIRRFFLIGFVSTNLQFLTITIIYALFSIDYALLGVVLLAILAGIFVLIFKLLKRNAMKHPKNEEAGTGGGPTELHSE